MTYYYVSYLSITCIITALWMIFVRLLWFRWRSDCLLLTDSFIREKLIFTFRQNVRIEKAAYLALLCIIEFAFDRGRICLSQFHLSAQKWKIKFINTCAGSNEIDAINSFISYFIAANIHRAATESRSYLRWFIAKQNTDIPYKRIVSC